MNEWDCKFIAYAKEVSRQSKDPSKQVGAVIVDSDNQIISSGYNDFPRGIPGDKYMYSDRDIKTKYIIHAEANAIYDALDRGKSVAGSTIYVSTLSTCHECAKSIIQTGITRVVCPTIKPESRWAASCQLASRLFTQCNIEVCYYDTNPKELY